MLVDFTDFKKINEEKFDCNKQSIKINAYKLKPKNEKLTLLKKYFC